MNNQDRSMKYADAGVDIDLGEAFIRKIKPLAAATHTPGVIQEIGSFAGLFDMNLGNRTDPILVACTDGVGTKLKLAIAYDRHDTIGIDLVAMSVNDLLVCGAEPLFFLDYLATGKLDIQRHAAVVAGITEGCRISGCALLGGETAEMPGVYSGADYDLAGFAVGIVERSAILDPGSVEAGDVLMGLESSGIHSNGYSLVRKILGDDRRYPRDHVIPGESRPLWEVLLEPTRIYADEIRIMQASGAVKSLAHITGGGIPGNLPRALPAGLGATIDATAWQVPPVFTFLAEEGGVDRREMRRTFNMGLGMIAVCAPGRVDALRQSLSRGGYNGIIIGEVIARPGIRFRGRHQERRTVSPARQAAEPDTCILDVTERKPRIAIFGSGRGSNMESLCTAIDRGDLPAEIACVISNNSRAYILERARQRDIPAFHISGKTHPGPDGMVTALLTLLKSHGIDLICLAGYMRKIPVDLLRAYPDRILNIHPALLPAFGGKGMYGRHVHEAVLQSGAALSGVTIHIVNEDYDKGRIIAQRAVPVLADDTPESLGRRVLKQEHDLYWRAVRSFLDQMNDPDRQ